MFKIKLFLFNPFVISIGFTVLANLIQVFAFMAQKNLDDSNFSLLNWGIYVFTILNIPSESLIKWVTIELGKIDIEKRTDYLITIARKSFVPFYLMFSIIFAGISLQKNSDFTIVSICLISALIAFWSIFPRAYLNVRERYLEMNLVLLTIPVIRLIFTVFFIANGNVVLLFWGLVLSSIIGTLLSYVFLFNDLGLNLKYLFNSLSNQNSFQFTNKILNIVGNVFLQIALSTFWLVDGLVLKNFLGDYDYSVYVSYSYIYKFPMFAAIGVAPVLLGKSVLSEANRIELKKTLRKSILIIFGLFGSFLLIEILFEGRLLELLGYTRYFKQGFSFIFGLAWLVQTLVYFVFTYLLKIKANRKTYVAIFLYSLSFIIGLYVFRDSIFSVMWFVLGQGLFFIIVNFALLLKK